jgi:hypothetical protein
MSKIEVNAIEPQCGTNLTVGASGDTITFPSGTTVVNNGSQTGFGRTGTVDWQTGSIKTANFTAANGEGYFCNTSGGVFTATLPASPSAGDIVAFSDYTRTFQTNNLTVGRNSEKIGGVAADAILETEGQTATFVYVDSTEGWINIQETSNSVTGNPNIVATGGTITTCGNCKIHTFTGPGTFTVTNISTTPANNEISYLVVAGGGGGEGGGAGAGGFREVKSPTTPYTASPLDGYPSSPNRITLTATSYPITVGGGGASGACGTGGDGTNSIFSTITSAGGGGGAAQGSSGSSQSGGSGGGSGQDSTASGGAGNTPPVSPPQGNPGGAGAAGPYGGAGAGGGATAVGSNAGAKIPAIPGSPGSPGGAGAGTNINPATGELGPGPSRYYSGGGAGGSNVDQSPTPGSIVQGLGGIGGGGDGGRAADDNGVAGTTNTGGGGGGGEWQGVGGAGGSGIVIIRYKYQ